MNHSHAYVASVAALFGPNSNIAGGQDVRSKEYKRNIHDIWLTFEQCGREFNEVDWEESRAVARKYHSVPKQCFDNCRIIALKSKKYEYYEGTATAIIPIEHSWLVRKDGIVVDPTFVMLRDRHDYKPEDHVEDYFGIRIRKEFLSKPRDMFIATWVREVEDYLKTHPVVSPEERKRA